MDELKYAGLKSRFLALLVDAFVFCLVFFPITRIVKGVWIMAPADHIWRFGWFVTDPLCVSFLFLIALYFIFLEGIFGRTIGKWFLGLRIIQRNGEKPGLRRALLRNILRLVDGLPAFSLLGAVMILVSQERARVGDLVSGTRVISVVRSARHV